MRRSAVTPGGHLQGRHFEPYFGGASAKIYTCFERKTASVMQNFHILGAGGGGDDHFLTKPRKGTSLADFTRFESLCVQIRSHVLSLGCWTKKRDTTKSHRQVIFHLFVGNRRNQPYQVWRRSVEGVQSYGGSNFGLLHRNGLSPITLCYT